MEFIYDIDNWRHLAFVDACEKEKREENYRNLGYLPELRKAVES